MDVSHPRRTTSYNYVLYNYYLHFDAAECHIGWGNKCSGMQQLSNSEVPLHVEDPPTSPVSKLVFFEAWYMGQAGAGWNAVYVGGRLLKRVWRFGSSWSMFADLTDADLRVGLSGMIGMWWAAPKNLQYWVRIRLWAQRAQNPNIRKDSSWGRERHSSSHLFVAYRCRNLEHVETRCHMLSPSFETPFTLRSHWAVLWCSMRFWSVLHPFT